MLPYLIKIVDNTFFSAILLALLLIVMGQSVASGSRRKFLLLAVMPGFTAALIYAVLKRTTGFAVREYYDLAVLAPIILIVPVFCIFLYIHCRRYPAGLSVIPYTSSLLMSFLLAYCLPDILLHPFSFSVGHETVFTAEVFYKLTGYLAGLLLLTILALCLCKTVEQVSFRVLVSLLCLLLSIFWFQQLLEFVQILIGRNLIPRYLWMVRLVITVLIHKNWFSFAAMAVLLLLCTGLCIKTHLTSVTGLNPAERRKMKAGQKRMIRLCVTIILCLSVSLSTMTYLRDLSNKEVEISPPKAVYSEQDMIRIPLNQVDDGHLHRFVYETENGTGVRFIVIKKSQSAYGVGLDACDICGASGYYQRGDQVVCKLCDVVMNISTIGFPGGCNPVPLSFTIAKGNMSIDPRLLEAERRRFE